MSSWDQVQRLPEQYLHQVNSIYGDHLPLDVRKVLSDWLDKQDWNLLNPDNPDMSQYLLVLANQFVTELEDRTTKVGDTVLRMKLEDAASAFRQNFATDPLFIVRVIRNCIMNEQKIIAHCESMLGITIASGRNPAVLQRIEEIRLNVQRNEERFQHLHKFEEDLVFRYQELQKSSALLQRTPADSENLDALRQEVMQLEVVVKEVAMELDQLRRGMLEGLTESVRYLGHVEHQILSEDLTTWQRAQQLAGNGQIIDVNFDHLQNICEAIAELIWQHSQLANKLQYLVRKMPTASCAAFKEHFDILDSQLKTLLTALVSETFVIEKQPPQVMKTNTRFTATVRLLAGGKINEFFGKPNDTFPQVRVSIISEAQANNLARNNCYPTSDVAGEILNNIGAMEYHQATRQLSSSFRNMSLKKIRRADKKGTESVMDEKFCLLFQAVLKVSDMTYHVQAQSLPVVVIVHGNQEPHAWATITWDNAFSDPKRKPFLIPESVPWNKMAQVLSTKFRHATGRGLSESNLHFLATKAFHNGNLPPDYGDLIMTWNQFCKEPLLDRSFTFWEWFYAIMKLTREHLRPLWNDGLIWGFVSRPEAEEVLLKKLNGTFLLRFSDSELGGVSIAWLYEKENNQKEILMIQPFTAKDFSIRSLPDRISDLTSLTYLYPDIPTEQAFCKYYTTIQPATSAASNGYVRPLLVTQLAMLHGMMTSDSNPATPLPYYGHSESSMFPPGSDNSFGDHNLQVYNMNAGGQPIKRQRGESFCSIPHSGWQEVTDHSQ